MLSMERLWHHYWRSLTQFSFPILIAKDIKVNFQIRYRLDRFLSGLQVRNGHPQKRANDCADSGFLHVHSYFSASRVGGRGGEEYINLGNKMRPCICNILQRPACASSFHIEWVIIVADALTTVILPDHSWTPRQNHICGGCRIPCWTFILSQTQKIPSGDLGNNLHYARCRVPYWDTHLAYTSIGIIR